MDYSQLAEDYKPHKINTLLVGEAPPQSGKSYFYSPTKSGKVNEISLPSTVFKHYFGKLPQNRKEYLSFLDSLFDMGIWVIDITDKPVKVWKEKYVLDMDVIQEIINSLPVLKNRIKDLEVDEKDVIFLAARRNYKKDIRKLFPASTVVEWSKFRNNG